MTDPRPIGILSLQLKHNYGGILQAYALNKALTQMGHRALTIDQHRPKALTPRQQLIEYPLRAFKKFILRQNKVSIFHEKRTLSELHDIYQFIDSHIPRYPIGQITDIDTSQFKSFVIGSDQVWRYPYWTGAYGPMTGAFGGFISDTETTPVISYAASFGLDNINEYPAELLPEITKLLHRFKAVSVREQSGRDICADRLSTQATVTLDPTMLLTADHYKALTAEVSPADVPLTTYILDPSPEKTAITDTIEKVTGNAPFALSYEDRRGVKPSPLAWLAAIRDTGMLVTDSFHGCVFAIIMGKPFIALANTRRGSTRIVSLLEQFGLLHHLVAPGKPLPALDTFADTQSAGPALAAARQASLQWLAQAIG